MKIKAVSGIMLTLLVTSMLTLAFNIQTVKASKPLAPNGVHSMTTYESRIGEQGLLFEDGNLQMWVPASYENHSAIIFDYLVAGYANLSSIFGGHEYPYKFSIEHYPPGSPYLWGGTDAQGTIRYGYSTLEDDTPEWNDYGVPHVVGYYEEMAHCFVYDFGVIGDGWGGGFSVGFYETLGLMIGREVTLRAAYNPYIEESVSGYYQVCNETTSCYLQNNTGPPGIGNNIWPTRVLSHIFKTEVVDVYGWNAFTNTFNYLQLEGYPLRRYDRDHTWGGFLNYLGTQTTSDLNTIFAGYGLPNLQWFEGDGYRKGVMQIEDNNYSFRVKCFDREGDQPSDVKLHVYSIASSTYAMSFIGGNNETGWAFEANVTLAVNYTYAFSARDGAHSIFQAVGLPTLMHGIKKLRVPQDYATIQAAINAANSGDTIFVSNGTYYERGIYKEHGVHFERTLVVNKTVSLVGENKWATIIDNGFTGGPGVWITSDNVTISGFTIKRGNPSCFDYAGILLQSEHCVIRDNIIEGSVPFTWNDFNTGISLVGSNNNVIDGNIISGTLEGIRIMNSNENLIINNSIGSVADSGIYVHDASNGNWIEDNIVVDGQHHGIMLDVGGNTLRNNELINNRYNFGINPWSLSNMMNNIDTSNRVNGKPVYYLVNRNDLTFANLEIGFLALVNSTSIKVNSVTVEPNDAVLVAYSNNSILTNIEISNSGAGIALSHSFDNSIYGNNIANNVYYAIHLYSSSNNKFYHNNFVDNPQQVYIVTSGYANLWDDGYPSGGNYWSNYNSTDLLSSPNQNETGSDGIGDTPYFIDENNQDNYPLMNPWTPKETSVKVKGKDYPVTIVSNTTIDQIVATSNTLHFKSSGPTGEKGYINVIFPMVNTTKIKIFIDGDKLTPPPFPVITFNGTHYFIYFEFTLSTHNITIQFGPTEPVGGIWIPVNKRELLAPYIGLTILLAVAVITVGYVKKRKRNRDYLLTKQSKSSRMHACFLHKS